MIPTVVQTQAGPATGLTLGTAGGSPGGNSVSGQTPSTEGFLHVLDMLLSGSPLTQTGIPSISGLIFQTAVTTSFQPSVKSASKDDHASSTPLDPALIANIASLLQALGFQVRPEQIAQLTPMDRQQLDSALEFVSRNLQRGISPSQVAENAALLLPRPWPLDDRDGSPTSKATAVTGQEMSKLPAGFVQALDQAQNQLHVAVVAATAPAPETPNPARLPVLAAQLDPPSSTSPVVPLSAKLVSGQTSATLLPSAVNPASKPISKPETPAVSSSDAATQVLQGLQQGPLAKDGGTSLLASEVQTRHLPPGGPASELIGRQVLEKVQVQLSEGKRELSLRLWPEELGEVRLSLRMTEGDKVHAHMVVENDSVRQAMLDSMPQLRDALTKHGMDLEKMTVTVNQKDAGSAGSGNENGTSDNDGRSSRRNGHGGGFRDEEISVSVPLVFGHDTGRRNGFNTIDLWS